MMDMAAIYFICLGKYRCAWINAKMFFFPPSISPFSQSPSLSYFLSSSPSVSMASSWDVRKILSKTILKENFHLAGRLKWGLNLAVKESLRIPGDLGIYLGELGNLDVVTDLHKVLSPLGG